MNPEPVNSDKLRKLLMNRRREILEQVAHLEAEGEELEQRFIEPIDAAQKEDLARLVHKLDKRLKVLPATRLCHSCAQKYEENQKLRKHQRDEIIDDELLDEYRNLVD